jgi:hypothetical protein
MSFDFGFTLVDEDELDSVQKIERVAKDSLEAADYNQDKLDSLYNAIMPLLTNLKANPEKEYIKWPDRVAKVEEFETHLQGIYNN